MYVRCTHRLPLRRPQEPLPIMPRFLIWQQKKSFPHLEIVQFFACLKWFETGRQSRLTNFYYFLTAQISLLQQCYMKLGIFFSQNLPKNCCYCLRRFIYWSSRIQKSRQYILHYQPLSICIYDSPSLVLPKPARFPIPGGVLLTSTKSTNQRSF